VGKATGQPVYNLLGGACRDRIRVYANGWAGWSAGKLSPEELAARAVQVVERGFTALKFDPFPGPWRALIARDQEREAVERVRAVREAVGPEVDILVEVHRRLAPMHAVRVADMLEELDIFWYEEPVDAGNLDALAEVKGRTGPPVVTGEALYSKAEFREVFERCAADIINPDVCNCGGILELKEIAAMAEPYYIAVAPHNYNSTTIGLAATVQVAACIPNFLITEYFVNFAPRGDEISVDPIGVEGGYIPLPTLPGLGLDLDEEAMARHPYRSFPKRRLRRYHQEGP
jgi:galactonate dehydratase